MKILLIINVLCIALFSSQASLAQTRLSVGVVPQFDAQKISEIWEPILQALSKETGLEFYLSGSPTIPAFESQFNQAKFDLAYMNPYHALESGKAKKYIPLVRDIGKKLHGIIVVKKNSPITALKQLDGKTIAFPSPNALGASLLPRADLTEKHHLSFTPKYVQSHSSVYLNVVLGRVDAGGGVQKTLSQQRSSIRDKLRVIYKSEEFAPHPIVVSSKLPVKLRENIRKALLKIANTPSGKAMFARIPINKLGPASLDDYKPLSRFSLEKYYQRD